MIKSFPYILKNNTIIPEYECGIDLNHGGFLYGYGVFESILIKESRPCLLDEHIARLCRSAAYINLSLSVAVDVDILKKHIKILIEKNNVSHARLNIYYTAGKRGVGNTPFEFESPELLAICRPYNPSMKLTPLKLGLLYSKYDRTSLDAHKTLNYMKPILDRQERPDCDDVIIIDKRDAILEASTANVFLVKGKTLITPEDGVIVPGVMRDHICDIAPSLGLAVEKRRVIVEELESCDEIFLTNSLCGVTPILMVDDQMFLSFVLSEMLIKAIMI